MITLQILFILFSFGYLKARYWFKEITFFKINFIKFKFTTYFIITTIEHLNMSMFFIEN